MNLIDTHAHLTFDDFRVSLPDVLARSRAAGVDQWLTIGTDLPDSAAAVELCNQHDNLYAAVGVHPHEAGKLTGNWLDQLKHLTKNPNVKAIGETGLDYYYEFSKKPQQQDAFAAQLDLAAKLNLPVIIHCRDAWNDCLAILDRNLPPAHPVVFHCFSGNPDQAQTLIDRGYHLSFTGLLTFKNAHDVQKAAQIYLQILNG